MPEKNIVTFEITTIDGRSTLHTWDLSLLQNIDEVRGVIRAISTNIVQAFTGERSLIFMKNPSVAYNPSHIISISFEIPPEVMTEEIRELGFRLPSDPH